MTELLQARLRVGLSQLKAACKIGVDPRTLRDWEHGKRRPWPSQRKALTDVYGLSLGELHAVIEATMAAARLEATMPASPPTAKETAETEAASPVI